MAKGQAKKVPAKVQAKVQPKIKTEVQADNMIFSLDIGTRSIIGMVGVVVEDKVKIIAIEKEEHTERAMIDGQIENIEKVSALAKKVKNRLEDKVHAKLKRVSVAAAGRALRTSRVDYEMVLQGPQVIDDEVINRLEAGAISKAEAQFDAENEAQEDTRRFYLVGYTVCQYYLDQYMISSLKDHRGKHIKVDLIATFLPSEVVESLYTTMNKIGLEVASITLEPIAAINAAIPENLRLLNLVIVDIGAGTSDIAACTSGSVTGYTMATIAGDEITEAIMKEFLVDFMTAENIKAQIEKEEEITFTDILGFERKALREEVFRCIQGMSDSLCREIAEKVLEVNGNAPSALFLAGGGSKLAGLKEGLTAALEMDNNRVAIAGNNFRTNAFSDEYDLNNPEYATPLGIAISSGLNMINDSFRVTLNEKSAKLFRSGSFTVMNLLMMNGYGFQDMLGRSGASVSVRVNGKRKIFYGMAAQPASLFINKKEGRLSDIVHAGDNIEFVPAVHGMAAKPCVKDIEGAAECLELTLNGKPADLETPLKNGDIIMMMLSDEQLAARKREAEEKAAEEAAAASQAGQEEDIPEEEEISEAVDPEEEEAAIDEGPEMEAVPVGGDMEEAEPESEAAAMGRREESVTEAEPESGAGAMGRREESVTEAGLESGDAALEREEPVKETEPESGAGSMERREESVKETEPESGGAAMGREESVKETGLESEAEAIGREEPVKGAGPESETGFMERIELVKGTDAAQPEGPKPEVEALAEAQKSENVSAPGSVPVRTAEPKPGTESVPVQPEPEMEELQLSQAEPMTEELQKYEAEPLTEETWNPKAEPAEGKHTPKPEPPKSEMQYAAEKLYNADEKSLVQGTLDLGTEAGGGPVHDAAPVRRHHPQRSGPTVKERTSRLPSIKEALASKGFSAKKEPAALRGHSSAKEPASGTGTILFYLNDAPLRLPLKKDGDSYYLMDMIEYSGIDLKQPKGRVTLSVNGEPGTFMQKLFERDIIRIVEEG